MKKVLNNWTFEWDGMRHPAVVPGDVTMDLMRCGIIDNIQFADNCNKYAWVHDTCFVYETIFEVNAEWLTKKHLRLKFCGIDTFADIYLNGTYLGYTKNMFRPYEYDVKAALKQGKNILRVILRPVNDELKKIGKTNYIAAFLDSRVLLRKAQCHFGWDWAPDYPGYGIWQNVELLAYDYCIQYVRTIPNINGDVSFITELNYTVREGNEDSCVDRKGKDFIRISVSGDNWKTVETEEVRAVEGFKNLLNLKISSPKLWYPNGYGEQPLYNYKVELIQDGRVADVYCGRFAFRSIKFDQSAVGRDRLNFKLLVNNIPIFCQGSNWVPADIMTGCVDDDCYRTLISYAKEAAFNMFRLWGGGIYEKDVFYDYCDECGILVWHDFMFACSDVPDDHDELNREVMEEAIYQVRRLNDHPCIAAWNGGNEILSAFRYLPTRLGEFLNYQLAGIVAEHSSVQYFPSCPWGISDFGNDLTSGDCHKCCFIEALEKNDAAHFRDYIIHDKPMATECSMIGSCRVKSLKKFLPEDKLWPMNELWETHLVCNPYNDILPKSFAKQEMMLVDQIFGGANDLYDFVKKSMIAHAEVLLSEVEFARSEKNYCGGIMNWMYNDIWSTATWSLVDYYKERKPVYYAMRRGFEKVRAYFFKKNNRYYVCVDNNTPVSLSDHLIYGQKRLRGSVVWQKKVLVSVPAFGNIIFDVTSKMSGKDDEYCVAAFQGKKSISFIYGLKDLAFRSDLEVSVHEGHETSGYYETAIEIKAKDFARTVFIDVAAEYKDIFFEDNYFDMESGEKRIVRLKSPFCIGAEQILVKTFADEWRE